jgi:hypothetical protein
MLTTVDRKRRAGDEAGFVGGEEHRRARDLLGFAEAIDRDLWDHVFLQHILRHRLHHFGIDIARADHIHRDAAPGVLQRQRLGEADVAGLGGRVVDLAELTFLAVNRGDRDDAAELAGSHALDHLARHVEQRAEIDVDHRTPLLERHLVEGGILGDAGIVDEHVDRPEIGLDFLDAGRAGIERGHIPFVDGDPGLGLEFLGGGVIAGVARRDLVARGLQRLADRRANASRTARHQCNTCHFEFALSNLFSREQCT